MIKILINYWWATMATIKLPLQFFVTSNLYQFTLGPIFYTHARKDVSYKKLEKSFF